jgi:phosphohistidine phosphatase
MKLYLVRHADALPVGGKIDRDAERPLSHTGLQEAALAGKALALLEPALDAVLVSPLLRARQTGERLTSARKAPVRLEVSPLLEPGFHPEAVLEELFLRWKDAAVALVGHQPDLGNLLSYLVSGDLSVEAAFRPGTIACAGISGTPQNFGGRLEWLVSPELLHLLMQPNNGGGIP